MIIKHKYDVKIRDLDGDTVLHIAAIKRHMDVLELLLEKGSQYTRYKR